MFDECTILFSHVYKFTDICSFISPMQVVEILNEMYTAFDTTIENYKCYKVRDKFHYITLNLI